MFLGEQLAVFQNQSINYLLSNARYINAYIWLHGSCAGITEGLCGNWNGNPADDLIHNNPNSLGEKYKEFDEHCPAPPPPYEPCKDIGPHASAQAEAICNILRGQSYFVRNQIHV